MIDHILIFNIFYKRMKLYLDILCTFYIFNVNVIIILCIVNVIIIIEILHCTILHFEFIEISLFIFVWLIF